MRTAQWLQPDSTPLSTRSFVLIVIAPLLAMYLLTTDWTQPYHVDPQTNSLEAWSLGVDGSPYMRGFKDADIEGAWGAIAFLVRTRDGQVTSKYPPGAALLAAPLYAATRPEAPVVTMQANFRGDSLPNTLTGPVPPVWQASLTAAVATAVAVTLLSVTVRNLVDDWLAIGSAYVFGLGTTAWSVAADALWQHGPAMMWLGLGLIGASNARWATGGLGFAGAVLTRPQTAVIALVQGIWESITRRSVRPALWVGALSSLGMLAFVTWNRLIIGNAVVEGQSDYFLDNLASLEPLSILANLGRALLHPEAGILIWSPVLIPLLLGVPAAWRASPSWVKSGAIGGLLYLLVQIAGNDWRGGHGNFTYRYPLEFLFVATPLLALAYRRFATTDIRVRIVLYLAIISVTIHGAAALVQ